MRQRELSSTAMTQIALPGPLASADDGTSLVGFEIVKTTVNKAGFKVLWLRRDGERRPKANVSIQCSECGVASLIQDRRGGTGELTFEHTYKVFANRRWMVGRTRSKDICPACAKTNNRHRLTIVQNEEAPMQNEQPIVDAEFTEVVAAPEPVVEDASLGGEDGPIVETPQEPVRAKRAYVHRMTPEQRLASRARLRKARAIREASRASSIALQEAVEAKHASGEKLKPYEVAILNSTPEQRSERLRAANVARRKAARKPKTRTASVPKPKEPDMAKPSTALTAIPPRASTVADRQRIIGALDINYDIEAGYYLRDYSDKKIGEELDVPAAWVAEVRAFSHGPLDRNRAVDALKIETVEIGKRIAKLTDEKEAVLERVIVIDNALGTLRGDLSALCTKYGLPVPNSRVV